MNPILTTITPYWNRPEMLHVWLKAIAGAAIPEVAHSLYMIREVVSPACSEAEKNPRLRVSLLTTAQNESIGHVHNLGAEQADTEWIMKLDVDALPHVNFFRELIPVLRAAGPRQWFNCGMFYTDQHFTKIHLSEEQMPMAANAYKGIRHSGSYNLPQATNFICRREDYLNLGGCDPAFRGWGWEDYQQIYMLEKYQRGADPLPGVVNFENVTGRCRDEISRPKAAELWTQHGLCLLHRWHPPSSDPTYKSKMISHNNRHTLLRYIHNARKNGK